MFVAKFLRYIPFLNVASKRSIKRCTHQKLKAFLHSNSTVASVVKDQVEFDNFLSKNHYFTKRNIDSDCAPNNEDFELDIGILGRELIRNWEAEWWNCIVMTNELAVGISQETTIGCEECNDTKNTALALLKMDPCSKFTKDQPSKIIAAIVHESNRLLSPRKKLVVGTFTALSQAKENYDLEFQTLRFVKKYLNKPQNLKLVQANTSEQRDIIYDNLPNYCVQQTKDIVLSKEEADVCVESLKGTLISIDMNYLILTTLMDALDYRDNHHIIKLNPKLAPIKVIVLLEQSADVSPTLQQLTEEICCMLRGKNISCWNGLAKNTHLEQADELGIPFALIVPQSVLSKGLLYLRMLTTTIKMEVHITEIENLLTKYLRAD